MAKQRPVFYNLAQRICAERLAPFSKASIALLLSIAATVAACRDDSGSTMREEIGKLREEVLALKQLHYEVLNMQNEISALKARQQKDTTAAESPIKPAAFTPDGSHKDDPFLGPKDAAVV
ncbi:MAG TPA: hypothetical protein PLP17_01205, partial [Oligoflexia bacterium]|nr:hypothetical protein [Oligoflexia bacterium]